MKGGASSRGTLILALPVLGLLIWLVLYPNLFVMGDSLVEGGELTLRWYRDFVGSRARMEALRGSVWISLASVATSALVGIPLAFLLTRRDFPGRGILSGLAAVPVLLPSGGVMLLTSLFGERRMFTHGCSSSWAGRTPVAAGGRGRSSYVHDLIDVRLLQSAGLRRLSLRMDESAGGTCAGSRTARIFWVTSMRRAV